MSDHMAYTVIMLSLGIALGVALATLVLLLTGGGECLRLTL